MIQRASLCLLRSTVSFARWNFISQSVSFPTQFHTPMTIRYFGKKLKKTGVYLLIKQKGDKKKERTTQLKEEISKKYEGVDPDTFLNEAKAKMEGCFIDFKIQLKKIKANKCSPRVLGEIVVYIQLLQEEWKKPETNLKEVLFKN